jgi:hypothetical protein
MVIVTKQENVGPYDTVQLHASDSSALNNWLAQNGFVIPANVTTVIDAYVAEGFDFLAMKLLPNQGVQAMRPVRVTTPGASLSLPLRMASIGTGPIVGITIWIVSDGRYEPQNFPFFHIDDSQLVWDWATNLSNYTTLRVQNDALYHNKGWEIESSLTLNQQTITNLILAGGQSFGGGFAAPAPTDPSVDYLPIGDPDAGADGGFESAEQVRTADVQALFAGLTGPNARITRIRSDIAQSAMTADLVFQASADQSELSNVRNVTQSVNLVCPTYPNTCGAVTSGSTNQSGSPSASGSFSSGSVSSAGSFSSGSVSSAGSPSATGSLAGSFSSGSFTTGSSAGSVVELSSAPAGGGGGCVASAQPSGGTAAGFGALAGMLGLFVARGIRSRRASSRKD